MEQKLIVNASPHVRDRASTSSIMGTVILALMPNLVATVYLFGLCALLLTAVCVVSCVVFEYLYCILMKKESTVGDLSAVVTGLLLAFNLPSTLPLWMAMVGCLAAIVVVKQLFGGIGKNFANPAIVGRIILLVSFGTAMTTWVVPQVNGLQVDQVAGATPLAILNGGEGEMPSLLELFLGVRGGSMGETCALALLIGGIFLIARRVITPTIPLAFLGTMVIMSWITGQDPLIHLLSGGAILGAFFMATDYVTSPMTETGKLIFGIGCGLITMMIRVYGSYPEGVSFAILLMNIVTPHINNLTRHKVFGGVKG